MAAAGWRWQLVNLVSIGQVPCRSVRPVVLLPESDSVEAQIFRDSEPHTVEDCSRLSADDPPRRDRGSPFVGPILFRDATIAVLSVVRAKMDIGMPMALRATILRTTIRARAELAEDPGRLLTVINRQLSSDLNNLGIVHYRAGN